MSPTTFVADEFAFALDIYISSWNKATVHPAILPQVLVHPGEETTMQFPHAIVVLIALIPVIAQGAAIEQRGPRELLDSSILWLP